MIKTGPQLKQVREALGWTPAEMARALRLAGGESQGVKRVQEMESGKRDISGPVTVAIEGFLRGFTPHEFKRDADGGGEQPEA
jgi:transcriptional regulator with XRE-family HTH domain